MSEELMESAPANRDRLKVEQKEKKGCAVDGRLHNHRLLVVIAIIAIPRQYYFQCLAG